MLGARWLEATMVKKQTVMDTESVEATFPFIEGLWDHVFFVERFLSQVTSLKIKRFKFPHRRRRPLKTSLEFAQLIPAA